MTLRDERTALRRDEAALDAAMAVARAAVGVDAATGALPEIRRTCEALGKSLKLYLSAAGDSVEASAIDARVSAKLRSARALAGTDGGDEGL